MDGAKLRKYTFEVAKNANKIEIAHAVEELFKVQVANGIGRLSGSGTWL